MTATDPLDLNNIAEYREVAERRRDLREQRAAAQQEVVRLQGELRVAAAQREARAERNAIAAILAGREPDAVPDLDAQLQQARRRLELVSRAVREFEAEEYAPTRARAVRMISERFVDEHRSAVVEIAVAIERLELAMEHEKEIRQTAGAGWRMGSIRAPERGSGDRPAHRPLAVVGPAPLSGAPTGGRSMIVQLQGVAVVFGEQTARGPAEVILPGAFRQALERGHPVRLETLHAGDHHVFARTSTGTMRVADTEDGLFFSADLDLADPQALNLVRAIEAGLRNCSISFRPLVVHERPDGVTEVIEGRLREISVVGLPCYERTGCWLETEGRLPGPLAELRSIWREPPPMQQPFLDPISNRVCFRERAA